MVQFIMEAVVLCEVGGVVGVVLGILGGNATALLLKLPPVDPGGLDRHRPGDLLRRRNHLRHLSGLESRESRPD